MLIRVIVRSNQETSLRVNGLNVCMGNALILRSSIKYLDRKILSKKSVDRIEAFVRQDDALGIVNVVLLVKSYERKS